MLSREKKILAKEEEQEGGGEGKGGQLPVDVTRDVDMFERFDTTMTPLHSIWYIKSLFNVG